MRNRKYFGETKIVSAICIVVREQMLSLLHATSLGCFRDSRRMLTYIWNDFDYIYLLLLLLCSAVNRLLFQKIGSFFFYENPGWYIKLLNMRYCFSFCIFSRAFRKRMNIFERGYFDQKFD